MGPVSIHRLPALSVDSPVISVDDETLVVDNPVEPEIVREILAGPLVPLVGQA